MPYNDPATFAPGLYGNSSKACRACCVPLRLGLTGIAQIHLSAFDTHRPCENSSTPDETVFVCRVFFCLFLELHIVSTRHVEYTKKSSRLVSITADATEIRPLARSMRAPSIRMLSSSAGHDRSRFPRLASQQLDQRTLIGHMIISKTTPF